MIQVGRNMTVRQCAAPLLSIASVEALREGVALLENLSASDGSAVVPVMTAVVVVWVVVAVLPRVKVDHQDSS